MRSGQLFYLFGVTHVFSGYIGLSRISDENLGPEESDICGVYCTVIPRLSTLVIHKNFAWNGTFGQNPHRFTSLICHTPAYSEVQRNKKNLENVPRISARLEEDL
jgi:hypothetical protein